MSEISNLDELGTIDAAADLLVIVDTSDTSGGSGGTTKRINPDALPVALDQLTGAGTTGHVVTKQGDGSFALEAAGGGGGDVDSVFGRTGAVTATAGDYGSDEITNDSGVTGATVSAALDNLVITAGTGLTDTSGTFSVDAMVGDSGAGGTAGAVPAPGTGDAAANKYLKADGTWATPAGSGAVDSVFGRSGVVVAASGDYGSDEITNDSGVTGATVSAALDNLVITAGTGLTDTSGTFSVDAMVGDSGAGGTAGAVPAPGTGDAAAGKYLKADGTWAVPPDTDTTPPVDSVFGRTGAVTATAGDYGSDDITNESGVPGSTVSAALDNLGSDDITNDSGVTGASVSDALDNVDAAIPTAGAGLTDTSGTWSVDAIGSDDITNDSDVTGTTASDAVENLRADLAIHGLEMSQAADADHDIKIEKGSCWAINDDVMLRLTSSITKRVDAAWSAGNNNGGLFNGTVATSTMYSVFLIRKDSDGSIDAGFDTFAAGTANIPAGYSVWRRIHCLRTDASANWLDFVHRGNDIIITDTAAPINLNTTSPATTSTLVTCSVPPARGISARLYLGVTSSATANKYAQVFHGANTTNGIIAQVDAIATGYMTGIVPTDTSGNISYLANTATAITVVIITTGWRDERIV